VTHGGVSVLEVWEQPKIGMINFPRNVSNMIIVWQRLSNFLAVTGN
jgi:hypothetical protein